MKELLSCYLCGCSEKKTIQIIEHEDVYINLIDSEMKTIERIWQECLECGFHYPNYQLEHYELQILYQRFRESGFRNESPDDYFNTISGNILDIGCGGGVFLYTFLQHFPNWSAFGVEPTLGFAELARKRLGIEIVSAAYGPELFGNRFNMITLIQVLEHIADPLQFLSYIRSDLATYGYVYIEVPNSKDFSLLPKGHDRFMSQHLWYFTDRTLKSLIEKAGLRLCILTEELTVRGRNNICALVTAK